MGACPQNFVENFSEFSAAQRNAGKHVTLMSELSRLVEARTLMTVGPPSMPRQLPCEGQNDASTYQLTPCLSCDAPVSHAQPGSSERNVLQGTGCKDGVHCLDVQVSSTEQEVCCSTGNMSAHYEAVRSLIDSHNITDNDRQAARHLNDCATFHGTVLLQKAHVSGQDRPANEGRCHL